MANGTLILRASGGDVTFSPAGLVAGAGRKSAVFDIEAYFNCVQRGKLSILSQTKWASAPTAGELLRIAVAWSFDGETFAGGIEDGDAAMSDVTRFSQLDELVPIVAGADTNAQVLLQPFQPLARYGVLCVLNSAASQALSATAADHIFTIGPATRQDW